MLVPISPSPCAFRRKFPIWKAARRTPFPRSVLGQGSTIVLLAVLATVGFRPVSASDEKEQDQRGRIRTEVTLVGVLASVLDKDGRPVLGLTADRFEIYEEGVKQEIATLEPETQQPLDLALMIDSSLSEVKELEFEADAASRFIQKLVRPADRLAVYEFADAVTQLAPFSSNVPSLQAALHRSDDQATARPMYDAIFFLDRKGYAKNPVGRRRAIIAGYRCRRDHKPRGL